MITAVSNARGYDWATWLIGIVRAFISGGAGAIAGVAGPMLQDPKDWNFGGGLHKVLESMAIGFLIAGIVHLGVFLQTHGAPDKLNGGSNDVSQKTGSNLG